MAYKYTRAFILLPKGMYAQHSLHLDRNPRAASPLRGRYLRPAGGSEIFYNLDAYLRHRHK